MAVEMGKKLKILRKGRRLTQQELADRLNISRTTISNYEVGRREPHISELRRFAEFYGVSLSYFGVETQDEGFELLSRAKEIFCNENIPREEREKLYREIMRLYLEME